MMILQVTAGFPGQAGVNPRVVPILTSATLAQLTAAGFLNNETLGPNVVYPTDVMWVRYNYDPLTGLSDFGIFLPTFSAGVITLSQDISEGNVELPVVANHLAVFVDTAGKIGDTTDTAAHVGNLYLGQSGTAGLLRSYDTTAASGAFQFQGRANSGNYFTSLRNNAMGQNTVINIPNPAGASASLLAAPSALVAGNLVVSRSGDSGLVQDFGAALSGRATATYGGGGTSHAFVATGLTASSIVIATIASSTNAVAIAKAVPSTDTLTITFTADPGAGTVISWIALSTGV